MTHPADGGATAQRALQLELFSNEGRDTAESPAVRRERARAAVSPGWWPYVAALFDPSDNLDVSVCEERDGELVLEAASRDSGAARLDAIVAHIREGVADVCGACGARWARPVRLSLADPTRRVCASCEARLRNGESYLAIADDFWRLDGSRRTLTVQPQSPAPVPESVVDELARPIGVLSPDDLRLVIREIHDRLAQEIVGHAEVLARLALLGGLHVGAGLPRGARALIVGPSGAGKTSLLDAFRRAMSPWGLPTVTVAAGDITSPGWSGAPTIAALVEAALGRLAPNSPRARRAVVTIEELAHARVDADATGNMRAKQREVLASLLGLTGYGLPLHLPESRRSWSSDEALVIGVGAFTGLLDLTRPVSVRDIVEAGIPIELATRFAEDVIVMQRLSEEEIIALLHRWPALTSLVDVCGRLGYTVRIAPETYRHAARAVTLAPQALTARTAGSWLVSALRRALLAALGSSRHDEIMITPDSLGIPWTATKPARRDRGHDEGPELQLF